MEKAESCRLHFSMDANPCRAKIGSNCRSYMASSASSLSVGSQLMLSRTSVGPSASTGVRHSRDRIVARSSRRKIRRPEPLMRMDLSKTDELRQAFALEARCYIIGDRAGKSQSVFGLIRSKFRPAGSCLRTLPGPFLPLYQEYGAIFSTLRDRGVRMDGFRNVLCSIKLY